MNPGLLVQHKKVFMEVAGNKMGRLNGPTSTQRPKYEPCLSPGHRHCADGSCMEFCPEDQMMNQSTILIMIVVGICLVIFLTVLYCFQQRSQRLRQNGIFESADGEGVSADHASLNNPPPTYEEVINSNLYPPTPVAQRSNTTQSLEEPRTPPPNYDMALHILAHSSESVLHSKPQPSSPLVRRSVSTDQGLGRLERGSRALSQTEYRRLASNIDSR